MPPSAEIRDFLRKHLQAVFDSDLQTYHATTVPELTLYEWYITPHRIDGIHFHDFQMTEVKFPDGWKVVHVHKSPSWNAPFQAPFDH